VPTVLMGFSSEENRPTTVSTAAARWYGSVRTLLYRTQTLNVPSWYERPNDNKFCTAALCSVQENSDPCRKHILRFASANVGGGEIGSAARQKCAVVVGVQSLARRKTTSRLGGCPLVCARPNRVRVHVPEILTAQQDKGQIPVHMAGS